MCAAGIGVDRPGGARPASAAIPPAGPPPGRPLRVLHLEDNPADSELAREQLDMEGIRCELRRVETREQFQAALEAGAVDLILADFQLPTFDGLTAFLLARELHPGLPFIMLTGKLGEEYAIDTLKLGVTDYVLKQSFTRLGPAVQRALQEQRERAQRLEAEAQLRRHRQHLEDLVRQRTAEIEARNRQLDAANRDLESFVASVTHDLRGPLVVIGASARRLERLLGERLEPDDLEVLQGLIAAEARAERLLDDLLSFFRASTVAPRRVPVEMGAAVREAFAELLPLVGKRQVYLVVPALPAALGDPAMVRQVLVNLLANAVKFTRTREQAVIEVSGWEDPDATGYCVRDNGVGFDALAAGRLFGLFERLHDAAEFPGSGVGLATVKRIVEKHGGEAWATGAVGEGASFCFSLPKPPAPPTASAGGGASCTP